MRCAATSPSLENTAAWPTVMVCEAPAYWARLQTTVAVPPPDAAGTVYCSASPVTVKARRCSVPSQLGNVEVSIVKAMVWSAALTAKVPKWVLLPWTIALFSAGVAVVRLLEAILGSPARTMVST